MLPHPLLGREIVFRRLIHCAGITQLLLKQNITLIVKSGGSCWIPYIRRAFDIVQEKWKAGGQCFVDITKDVTANEAEYIKQEPNLSRIEVPVSGARNREIAATLIKRVQKPHVFVGGGAVASEAHKRINYICAQNSCSSDRFFDGKGCL